jgi:hypothetical protein
MGAFYHTLFPQTHKTKKLLQNFTNFVTILNLLLKFDSLKQNIKILKNYIAFCTLPALKQDVQTVFLTV